MGQYTLADQRGGVRDAPLGGPNSFNFMQFFGKIWQNHMLKPPGGLAPPPRGNPGSTTEIYRSRSCIIGFVLRKLFAVTELEVSRTQI